MEISSLKYQRDEQLNPDVVFLLETYTYLQVLLNLEFDHLSSFENPHVGRNSHLVEWCSMQCIKLLLSASLKAISKLIKKKKKGHQVQQTFFCIFASACTVELKQRCHTIAEWYVCILNSSCFKGFRNLSILALQSLKLLW